MTHDPEAAERLAQTMVAFADEFRREERPALHKVCLETAALIRAQAAEIERLSVYEQYDQCTCGQSCPLHPDDTPPPQPDADEREAMVSSWTRTAEIEAEKRGAERARPRLRERRNPRPRNTRPAPD